MINNIYLYAKEMEKASDFDFVLQSIMLKDKIGDIFISAEPRRSYYELEKIKSVMKEDDVCIILNLSSLGLNDKDIAVGLDWFITTPRLLVIANFSNSYLWGVSQPMNRAILSTLQQTLLGKNEGNTIIMPDRKKSNAGRKLISFPDNWEELYGRWENKEISSKEFCELSGLKKATFYNLMTEYREMKKENENYFKRYRSV